MATSHSYGATLKNNKTESEALLFLLSCDPNFVALTKETRAHAMGLFRLGKSFARAFDLVLVKEGSSKNVLELTVEDMTLIELKTTQKKLLNLPLRFFFGATENEFKLARQLGDKYQFCFISLHPESRSHHLITLTELEKLIKTNRTQYQINL